MHDLRSRGRSVLAMLAASLLGAIACGDAPPAVAGDDSEASSDDGDTDTEEQPDQSSTGEAEQEVFDACFDACADRTSQAGIAMCHSCRCKEAFDGWLPPVDQLQCEHGEPILTYHAELSETDYTLSPVAPSTPRCANPSLLTSSCRPGSRLGQITHGDVSVYWICRDPYIDFDGSRIYEDMAVVGHNERTGATCFWDDINDVMHDDDAPPLDLLEASADERDRSIELFAYADGSGCVTCHDSDPFIYTPYLQSTGWQSIAADKGPYHLVSLDGAPRPIGTHLVSEPADPCTRCHRLGGQNSCSLLLPDALATHKISAYESEVLEASEPGSPHWALAYWMPSVDATAEPVEDFDQWEQMYARARDHILQCCETPGQDVGECQWAPVPTER